MGKKQKPKTVRAHADIAVGLFKVAAQFCSDSEERNYISGVRIERHPDKGIMMIGTDGHRMFIAHDVRGRCSHPFTLDAKQGLKAARRMDKSTETSETRWRVSTHARKGTTRIARVEGDFPQWRKIPEQVAITRGGTSVQAFNPKYIDDFMRAAKQLGAGDVIFVPGKTLADALLVLFDRVPHVCAILMPKFNRHAVAGLPSFMAPLLKRAK